ncbi:MAG: hypothetical protein ACLSVG_02440 [Clostridia bacterium]
MAKAFHIKGYHVKTTAEFLAYAKEVKERRIPALFDIDVRRNERC